MNKFMKFRNPIFSAAAVGMLSVCCQSASAQLLFSEGFNYSPGTDLGGNVNPGSSVAWTGGNGDMAIGSSQLSYAGLQQAAGYDLVYTTVGGGNSTVNTYSAVTSGSLYYSFLIDCTTLPTGNNNITSLNPGTTTPGGGTDAMAIYTGTPASGFWKIGVRTTGGGSGAAYSSGNLSPNTTYLVVGELTFGSTSVANIFVDPTPGGSQPAANATQSTTTAIPSVADVGFKVQSSGTAGNYDIDDLLIGTTWASVTPATVPEPSTFALFGSGMVLLQVARRRLQTRS
jgi:hypothetical protein